MQNTSTTTQNKAHASAILQARKANAQALAEQKAQAQALKKAQSKKPGIIATIRTQILQATSKQKAVTQAQILQVLVKAFSTHAKQSMRKTVTTQLNISAKTQTCRAERESGLMYNVFYTNNVAHYYFTAK